MYKVFFNDCRLIISETDEGENLNNSDEKVCLNEPHQLSEYVLPFLENCTKSLTIYGNMTDLWNHFKTFFHLIPAAGGLVKSSKGYLFIFRKGKWDLPKGKIDEGETPEEAAVREVKEETGLQQVKIIQPLPSTWHIYFSKFDEPGSKPFLKETRWFLMEANPEQVLVPEKGEGITEICWFNTSELLTILSNTFDSLRDLITGLR
jgi:8-oxo-dGTP pyrophosphatase MutT (NUDIX family)